MIVIEFMEPLIGLIAVVAGLTGFLYAGERLLDKIPGLGSKIDTEDKQTRFFKYLSVILGFTTFGLMILIFLAESSPGVAYGYHAITIVLLLIYGVIIISHPIRDLEGWKFFAVFIPIILVLVLAITIVRDAPLSFLGFTIPLWLILGGLTILLFIIFALIFFSEETMVDPLLSIIGWAPFVIIVSALLLLHGILFFLPQNGVNGLSGVFPDLFN